MTMRGIPFVLAMAVAAPLTAQILQAPNQPVPLPLSPPQTPTLPAWMIGVWDVTGENESTCLVQRPTGTLTVLRQSGPTSFEVRQDFVWHRRAKPGCPAPNPPAVPVQQDGTMQVDWPLATITFRRPDGGTSGPWRYRVDGNRMLFQPAAGSDILQTTFVYVRRGADRTPYPMPRQ